MSKSIRLRIPIEKKASVNSASTTTTNIESPEPETVMRRGVRNRHKPKKYGQFLELSPMKRKSQYDIESSDSEDQEMCEENTIKPTALFGCDDVEGQDIFKFKSRHTKLDLQNKVKAAISSPKIADSPMRTPRKSMHKFASPMLKVVEATPTVVKDIMKKRIVREVESDSAESDFSASSSDFVPDATDTEESVASSEAEQDSSSEEEVTVKKTTAQTPSARNKTKMKSRDSEYIVTSDNYFMMNSSKKITTSDHTLARLKNMNLNDEIREEELQISNEHKDCIFDLDQSYDSLFDRWIYILSENFNLVLYGIGSKRCILSKFQERLKDVPCVVVNGFFPSLSVKNILEGIVVELLGSSHVCGSVGDAVGAVDAGLRASGGRVLLVVHNIDGPALRSGKAQAALAALSQLPNVHTIATIDHINAPLLWDHSKLSKFNFTWWDVTTFLPYTEETSYENSIMSHRSGALQLSSMRSVYQSLTSNAKGIITVIIQYQLENNKQSQYQGLPFKELYSKCREQFLVSSDLALRAQLTEFLDHKLVKMKRSYDGTENLIIPIDNQLLQQFLDQIS